MTSQAPRSEVSPPTPPSPSNPSAAVPRPLLAVLLVTTLAISTSYGVLLLLPLHITELGGDEADYGLVTAAAALPAALVLGLLIRAPRRFPPHALLAVSSAVYAGAAAGVALTDRVGFLLVALGLVLGTAWAVAYTVAPMVISDLVPDGARAQAIGFVTGTIQVGFGLGPILGSALHGAGLGYPTVFLAGAALAAVAVALVVPLSRQVRRESRDRDTAAAASTEERTAWSALRQIARSSAATPLAMILLSACLFTTMNSFQTTFADDRGLSYHVFYGAYTVAVIGVRLGLSPLMADSASDRVVRLSTAGMVLAVVGFMLVGSSLALYVAFSALLGVAYGMALPAVQARAVNQTAPDQRPMLLPLAGLLFEVAILVFPLVAGYLIRFGSYQLLFGVLLAFSVAVWLLGLRRGEPARGGRGDS